MSARARVLTLLAAVLATAPTPATAAGPSNAAYRPGEVVVRTDDGRTRVHRIRDGSSVFAKAAQLARRPGVSSATPNWIARAGEYVPNDPGSARIASGWQQIQWNLLPGTGIDAPGAWSNLRSVGRPGGQGVMVAVLDTGVAYRNRGRFRRSPDLAPERFRKGYDFIDNDQYPLDHNGHGTHVASTIAETADNGIGLVGIAYNARILPVRVLDRYGEGDAVAIARGIRFAVRKGAHIVNLSFEFGLTGPYRVTSASQIPDVADAIRYARKRRVLVVGASGNQATNVLAYPARVPEVLSVGAVTEHGCLAEYSSTGRGLDVVAPGGGPDADVDDPGCDPGGEAGRDIIQMTFVKSVRRFGLPTGYVGTSMAAPHVSAAAALVIASGILGPAPSPEQIEAHLKATSTDLGRAGADTRYGAGLINAARATMPPAQPTSSG